MPCRTLGCCCNSDVQQATPKRCQDRLTENKAVYTRFQLLFRWCVCVCLHSCTGKSRAIWTFSCSKLLWHSVSHKRTIQCEGNGSLILLGDHHPASYIVLLLHCFICWGVITQTPARVPHTLRLQPRHGQTAPVLWSYDLALKSTAVLLDRKHKNELSR